MWSRSRESIGALAQFNSTSAKTHSGIWRDLAVRKRKTEVDPQIGIIVRLAKEAGIAVPTLEKLVANIHAIEDGRAPQSSDLIKALL